MALTNSQPNNINVPSGNGLVVYIDGENNKVYVRDVRGATEELNVLTGSITDIIVEGGLTALQSGNTITLGTDASIIQLKAEKGQPNGYASLDATGKLPVSELPVSVLTYEGMWNAATNTPFLEDGVGNAGDFYIVSVEGTQDLGSGPIEFEVGDWVIYNGAEWQRNSSNLPDLQEVTDVGAVTTNAITTGGITTDFVQLDLTATPTLTVGMARWNPSQETWEVGIGDGPVAYEMGQSLYYPQVRNTSGGSLPKGALVMVDPTDVATGDRLNVVRAIANGTYPSQLFVGILAQNIASNETGFAVWFGQVQNASNSAINLGGQTWTEGQILYADPANPGGLTNVEPTAPNLKVTIAAIQAINGGNVNLLVRPWLNEDLGQLNDVQITSPVDNSILQFNLSTGVWENVAGTTTNIAEGTNLYFTTARARESVSASTGLSYVTETGVFTNTDRGSSQNIFKNVAVATQSTIVADSNDDTLTFAAGTNISLTTNTGTGTLTINTTGVPTGSGVANYVALWSSASNLTTSQIYDNGTAVGIATATPSSLLQIGNTTDQKLNFNFATANEVKMIAEGYAFTIANTPSNSAFPSALLLQATSNSGVIQLTAASNTTTYTSTGLFAINALGGDTTKKLYVNGSALIGNTSGTTPAYLEVSDYVAGVSETIALRNRLDNATGRGTKISFKTGASPITEKGSISVTAIDGNRDGYNMAFGTTATGGTISTKLTLLGSGAVQLNLYGSGTYTGTAAYNLAVDASGNIIETAGSVIDGSGTTNYLSKFTDSNTIGDSTIFDNGTSVGIGTITPIGLLDLFKSAAATELVINGDAGQNKIISYRVGGLQRFGLNVNNTAEAGANAGSDFAIEAYADAGTILSTPFFIKRATGNIVLNSTTDAGFKLDVHGTSKFRLAATFDTDITVNGLRAGRGNVNDPQNTAFGRNALNAAIGGVGNTAIGDGALSSANSGGSNTAVGRNALSSNQNGSDNVAVGISALTFNTSGAKNTAIGTAANSGNTSGLSNVGIGNSALSDNQTGSSNVAVGRLALKKNLASNNVAVGFEAATTNTTGTGITALGYQALRLSTGSNNTAVGFQALDANTTAANNSAFGASALQNNTGGNNTAVGRDALKLNTSASNNTAVGFNALSFNTTGNENAALGKSALESNTTGVRNSAVGFNALYANTTGLSNAAFGHEALRQNINGSSNSALGQAALQSNTSGSANTAVGSSAMGANQTGQNNSVLGVSALFSNSSGSSNSAMGREALFANSTGSNNAAIGFQALYNNTTGANNIALGSTAGKFLANGSTSLTITNNSVFLGVDSRANANNETNQIVIGHLAIGGGSNSVVIGNSSITSNRFFGTMRVGTINNGVGDFITTDANGVLTKRTAAETRTDIGAGTGDGSVTSVAMTVPTGFAIGGTPITVSGTLGLTFAAGYSLPTDARQTEWDTSYNDSITAFAYNTGTALLTLTQRDLGTLTTTITLQPFSTTNLAEGTNLYYTDARVRLALSAGTGISYDNATGVITNSDRGSSQFIFKNVAVTGSDLIVADSNDDTITFTAGSGVTLSSNSGTDTITISATGLGGTVTSVGLTAPTGFSVSGSPVTTSGTITLAFDAGYALPTTASQANWDDAYNNKITAASFGTGTGTLTLTQQDTGTLTTSFDGRYILLTEKGANNGVATLDAGGKIPSSQLPSSVFEYKGTWNAATNTPTLVDGVGDPGDVYLVGTAGTHDFGDGPISFAVGDLVLYDGAEWQKSASTNDVLSVNGQTGVVVLTTTNIGEGTNLYFTDARARTAISGGTGISYNSTTGTITNSDLGSSQNIFKNFDVAGQSTVSADTNNDTLTLVAGTNITITTNATTDTITINSTDQFAGTVTSVGMSAPTGFTVSGTPVTSSGTLGLAFAAGYSLPTDSVQADWTTSYNRSLTAFAYNTSTGALTLTKQDTTTLIANVTLSPFSTTNLAEGTNLYFTDARARTAISLTTSGTSGAATYNNTTGVFNIPQYQAAITNPVTGTGTTNYVPKFTSASAIGDSQIFDDGTSVGIGTTVPSQKLEVYGNQRISDNGILEFFGGTTYPQIKRNSSGGLIIDTSGAVASANSVLSIRENNGADYVTVGGNGYVGIGTTTPDALLDIESAANPTIRLTNSTDPLGAADVGTLEFFTKDSSSGASRVLSSIVCVNDADSPSIPDGQLAFKTSLGGASPVAATEKMRIDSIGNVGIGTTSPSDLLTLYATSQPILSLRDAGINTNYGGYIKGYGISGAGGQINIGVIDNNTYRSGIEIAEQLTSILFKTSASATERMRITSGGNVLIGTTTDSGYKLDVNGSGRFSGLLQVNGPAGVARADSHGISLFNFNVDYRISFDSQSGTKGFIRYNVDTAGSSSHGHIFSAGDFSGGSLTDLMLVRADGNVGIGTTSPNEALSLYGNQASILVANSSTSNNTTSSIKFSNGSVVEPKAAIFFEDTLTNNRGVLHFAVNSNTLGTPVSLSDARMTIANSGNVGIGTTSPGAKLHVYTPSSGTAIVVGRAPGNSSIKASADADGGYLSLDSTGNATIINHYVSDNVWLVTGGGNVLIGTTTDAGYKLQVAGTYYQSTASTEAFRIYGDSGDTNGLFRIQFDNVSDSFGDGARTFLGDGGIDIFIGTSNNSYSPSNTYIALNQGGEISMGAGSSVTKDFTLKTTGQLQLNQYGSGTFTGTATYNLAVDSSGNIIETLSPTLALSLYDLLPAGRVAYNWVGQVVNDTWVDIFSKSDNILTTGTWMVQMFVNDFGVGGGHYTVTYQGSMQWYQDATNQSGEAAASEIFLQRMGHAANASILYLRTLETTSATGSQLGRLQIKANYSNTSNQTIEFKFVKIF